MNAVKWNFAATALGAVVGVLQLWLLSRILGPHEYGIISLALMVVQFFTIFIDFGISNAIIRHTKITELELSSLYVINIALGVATFAAAWLASAPLAAFFNSPELVTQVRIMAVVFLIAPFGQQQRAMLARELRFNFIAVVAIITLLTNCVVVIALALLYGKAWAASVSFLASTALSCAIFFGHSLRERALSFRFSWPAARPHMRYAAQLVGDSLINVVSVNTYPALMARLVSLPAIGGYNIAYGISINLIERLKPVLTQALFPAFAKIQDDQDKLARNFLLVTTYGSLINFPLLMGMFVCSSSVVELFFKPEWRFIDVLVKILCLVGMVRSVDAPVISLLLVKAKMYLNVRMGVAKLLLGVPLAYALGTAYGIVGIAGSFLIVQLVNTVVSYFVLVRACVSGQGRAYVRALLIPLAQVLPVVLAAGVFIAGRPFAAVAVNLALAIAAGALAYVGALCWSPFPEAREFLRLVASAVSPRAAHLVRRLQTP